MPWRDVPDDSSISSPVVVTPARLIPIAWFVSSALSVSDPEFSIVANEGLANTEIARIAKIIILPNRKG
jgi:hypothetical protein